MDTLRTLTVYATHELAGIYEAEELRSVCQLIFTDAFGLTKIGILLQKDEELPESFSDKFRRIVARLKEDEPVQYVIGTTVFDGLTFAVNRATLIPRPETEGLVQLAAAEAPATARILDIGTGSGCIAVALAHRLPQSRVTAIDLSAEALETAAANAAAHSATVRFQRADLFDPHTLEGETFDLIVSNPPYVRESERSAMQPRVLRYEPPAALFVPDDDPLVFHRRIAQFGATHLCPGGRLCLEINESLGRETAKAMLEYQYNNIRVLRDYRNRDRYVTCTR